MILSELRHKPSISHFNVSLFLHANSMISISKYVLYIKWAREGAFLCLVFVFLASAYHRFASEIFVVVGGIQHLAHHQPHGVCSFITFADEELRLAFAKRTIASILYNLHVKQQHYLSLLDSSSTEFWTSVCVFAMLRALFGRCIVYSG